MINFLRFYLGLSVSRITWTNVDSFLIFFMGYAFGQTLLVFVVDLRFFNFMYCNMKQHITWLVKVGIEID